ncbi:MAG: sensor histidine kinase [Betaproteobacteria bacterium]
MFVTLAQFINQNLDAILAEWEAFALTLQPAAETMTALALRSHAREILQAMARDIDAAQTDAQQDDKSKGWAPVLEGKETAAATHGALRHLVGFDLIQLTSEYRALRASVIKLWREHLSSQQDNVLTEMTRFNEAVDQALAESVVRYSNEVTRSRDTFLAILGHDLRSPLSAVSMTADYLATRGKVDASALPAVVRIKKSVLTMSLMIRDLLEYTRTRLGKSMPVTPIACDIGLICETAHDEVQAAHPEFVFDLEMRGDLRGQVDRGRLQQVLSNLLNNAVQHGASGSPITVRAEGHTASVVLEVINLGRPIPAAAMQVIFNPMVQLRDENSPLIDSHPTSLGLGLFIARDIVAAHGGELRVESSEAAGTVFTVELPRIFRGRLKE